jgi:hypothetical protein
LQLSRDLNCQHKTAFVLAHKLREAMAAENKNTVLDGEIEIDGMYTGGSIRPANEAANRIDRRLDNGALASCIGGLAMAHAVSRQWKGYWQRRAA